MVAVNTLEIIIPTFNRAEHLYRTLTALYASPFSGARITILDNASTDDTPRIAQFFPGVRFERNSENIGAEKNYCQAVEISTGPYVWILGDDDSYCWQFGIPACDRFIETVLAADVDLIMPRVTFDRITESGEHSLANLAAKSPNFFFPLGFVPSLIFKRSLYTKKILRNAWSWSERGNLLPMMPFIDAMLARNSSVWISEIAHIDKGLRHGYSSINAMRDWIVMARNLRCGPQMMREMFGWPRCIANIVGSIACDPAGSRLARFRSLAEEFPMVNCFWPFALLPDFCQSVIRELLTLSRYDGDRGNPANSPMCKTEFPTNETIIR